MNNLNKDYDAILERTGKLLKETESFMEELYGSHNKL